MKKIISTILCVMMLVSLFAVNVSASIEAGSKQLYAVQEDFDGIVTDDYVFNNVTEATDADGTYLYSSESVRAYAQPVDYPEDYAYSIEFDSKFQSSKDGSVKSICAMVVDKNATEGIAEVDSSMDFYIRGDVLPENKGIDTSKWYSFRITIDKAAGITHSNYHGRMGGAGIKLQWKEKGADTWITAINDLTSFAAGDNLETDFGGEDLKYYVGRGLWQYTHKADLDTDGFGVDMNTYFNNFRIRHIEPSFGPYDEVKAAHIKYSEDGYGYYIHIDQYFRPFIQPVNYPDSSVYTIEFDSKFKNSYTGEAANVIAYVLDPTLVGKINNTNVATSLDFNIQGASDMETQGIDMDKWYTFRITIDMSMGIAFNGYYGRLQGNGIMLQWKEQGTDEWKTAVNCPTSMDYTGENLKYYVSRNYWQYVNSSDLETPGFGINVANYLDNFKVGYKEEIPSTGVLYYDDFEGASVLAKGNASVKYENGNNYLAIQDAATAWSGSGYATATEIPENFILTMDIYKEADCTGALVFEYWQTDVAESGVWGQTGINASDVEAGKWYTLKIAKVGEGRKYAGTLEDKETGEVVEITPLNRSTEITGKGASKFVFRGWKDGGALNWRVDNLILTAAAAASLPEFEAADGAVSTTISTDAIGENVTPVLALYKEDRLVAVDWDTAAVATEGALSELTASGDYDAVKVLLWDTFDGKPLFGEAWDITSVFAE